MVNAVFVLFEKKKYWLPKRLFGWLRLKNLAGRYVVVRLLLLDLEVCQILVLGCLVWQVGSLVKRG